MSDAERVKRAGPGNLQLRVMSGAVLAVLVLILTWIGGWPFRILAVGIAACVHYEWTAMARTTMDRRNHFLGWVLLAIVLSALAFGAPASTTLVLLAVATLICAADARLRGQGAWGTAGLLYAALSAVALASLRGDDPAGLLALLFLFAVVWSTDILAYFVGRAVGGPRLAPSISPGKTWSGAVGGAVAAIAAGLLLGWSAALGNWLELILLALALSVVAQAGDLLESWIKRRRGVKDSGRLIPGHGGVMDRVDGLVAAAVALFATASLLGGPDHAADVLLAVGAP